MLVTFGTSTVIMVRKMKSSSNTPKNTLIKRTYNTSLGSPEIAMQCSGEYFN